jgi:hypothetical protein
MRGNERFKEQRGGIMPLRRVPTEPEICAEARHNAESVKSEILADFRRLRSGSAGPTRVQIRQFQQRWLRGSRDVQNRLLARGLPPEAQHLMKQVEPILAEIHDLVQDCAAVLERALDGSNAVERKPGS